MKSMKTAKKATTKATPKAAPKTKKSASKPVEEPASAALESDELGPELTSLAIDAKIADMGDWRGDMLAHIRALIKQAEPDVVEELKWRGTPVWSRNGIICTGETYKTYIKTTFAKGAMLPDPSGLFNSSLEGNVRRAIDFHEGVKIDDEAFKALVRAAVALNKPSKRR